MKIKSIFSRIFITLFCLACCLNIAAKRSGTCGSKVTWELTDDGTLVISGEGRMTDYFYTSDNAAPWYSNKDMIYKVTIGEGISSIGKCAFLNCEYLTDVKMPSTCTAIGYRAFEGCSSIKKIEISNAVKSIGENCFAYCTNLTCISIPNGITRIEPYTFWDCASLKEILLPNTITTIEEAALGACYALEDIKIPENVKNIGKEAFKSCRNLKSINIPATVTTIGYNCFAEADNLQSINIDDFAAWCEIDFTGKFPINKLRINGKPIYIENLTIPDNVKKIGSYVFNNCEDIKYVKMSNSVASIGTCAFSGCKSLVEISLPSNLKTLGGGSFSNCEKLEYITIPESCTNILSGTFNHCNNLETITIPSTCQTIYQYAFDDCDNISDIYCQALTPPTIFENSFTEATFQNAMLHIAPNAIDLYKNTDIWKKFEHVTGGTDTPDTTNKCDSPTISYQDGKLIFNCSTPNATYNYDITDGDTGTGFKTTEKYITLYGKYYISVYATADGYKPSDTVTGTLYWIGGDLQTDNINTVKMRGIIASCHDGFISISGLDNNESVSFYTVDGKAIGIQKAISGTVSYAIGSNAQIVIARIGENSIKIINN